MRSCVLDDLSTGSMDNIVHLKSRPGFEYVIDTMMNESLTAELIDRADVVFHLAAAVGVKLIVEAPVRTIETNVHGTEIVLSHAAQEGQAGRHLLDVGGLRQEHRRAVPRGRRPRDWRDARSSAGRMRAARPSTSSSRSPTTARRSCRSSSSGCSTPSGRDRPGRYGMVIPSFVRQALNGDPITVYGNGRQSRSFTFVGDVVDGVIKLVHEPRAIGQVFNIGNTEEITILELAERIRTLTHSAFGDRLRPLRRGVHGRLRGHAPAGARPHQDPRDDRLPAHHGARRDPAHGHRLRAGPDRGLVPGPPGQTAGRGV